MSDLKMLRAQRLLLAYILFELQKPRIIQQITQPYRGGGGVSDHGSLTGREDDSKGHQIYALADKSRPATWVAETDVPVLTDAKYPNALLLSGERTMAADLSLTSEKKVKWSATEYIDNYDPIVGTYTGIRIASSDRVTFANNVFFQNQANFYGLWTWHDAASLGLYSEFTEPIKVYNGVDAYQTIMTLVSANPSRLDISQAGDITLNQDRMIQLSHESTSAVANAG